jgi:predicted ester cyclase
MSTSNADIVRSIIEAYDRQDFDAAAPLVEHCTKHTPVGTFSGWGEIQHFVAGFYQAFPDLEHNIVDLIQDGDTVATRVLLTGTHTGPLVSPDGQQVPPTGRSISMPSLTIVALRDGKPVDWYVSFDQMTMLAQLGLVPEPAAAG